MQPFSTKRHTQPPPNTRLIFTDTRAYANPVSSAFNVEKYYESNPVTKLLLDRSLDARGSPWISQGIYLTDFPYSSRHPHQ